MSDCRVETKMEQGGAGGRRGAALETSRKSLVERALTEVFTAVPPRERRGVRSRMAYVAETLAELERLPHRGADAEAAAEIRRRVRQKVLADLFDPTNPLASEPIAAEASEIARANIVGAKRSWLRHRFGDVVVDPSAAESVACEALIELGKAKVDPENEPIRDLWAYLATIIDRRVTRLHSRELRSTAPGLYAVRQISRRIERALREERPELDSTARQEIADSKASTEAAGLGWSNPHSREELSDEHGATSDPLEIVEDKEVIRVVHELVQSRRFTDTDRETWMLLLEADGNGGDIPWPDHGVPPHTGSQRLYSLLEKVRRALDQTLG